MIDVRRDANEKTVDTDIDTDFSPINYLKENGSLINVSGDSPEEQDYGKCE